MDQQKSDRIPLYCKPGLHTWFPRLEITNAMWYEIADTTWYGLQSLIPADVFSLLDGGEKNGGGYGYRTAEDAQNGLMRAIAAILNEKFASASTDTPSQIAGGRTYIPYGPTRPDSLHVWFPDIMQLKPGLPCALPPSIFMRLKGGEYVRGGYGYKTLEDAQKWLIQAFREANLPYTLNPANLASGQVVKTETVGPPTDAPQSVRIGGERSIPNGSASYAETKCQWWDGQKWCEKWVPSRYITKTPGGPYGSVPKIHLIDNPYQAAFNLGVPLMQSEALAAAGLEATKAAVPKFAKDLKIGEEFLDGGRLRKKVDDGYYTKNRDQYNDEILLGDAKVIDVESGKEMWMGPQAPINTGTPLKADVAVAIGQVMAEEPLPKDAFDNLKTFQECHEISRQCDRCSKTINGIQSWRPGNANSVPWCCKECFANGNKKLLDGLAKIEASRMATAGQENRPVPEEKPPQLVPKVIQFDKLVGSTTREKLQNASQEESEAGLYGIWITNPDGSNGHWLKTIAGKIWHASATCAYVVCSNWNDDKACAAKLHYTPKLVQVQSVPNASSQKETSMFRAVFMSVLIVFLGCFGAIGVACVGVFAGLVYEVVTMAQVTDGMSFIVANLSNFITGFAGVASLNAARAAMPHMLAKARTWFMELVKSMVASQVGVEVDKKLGA